MDNEKRRTQEVAVLAAIVYFLQGALGITAVALPIYLRNLGWSISEITVIASFVAFPWVLKIVYGLLSDCVPFFSYRRKSYLILFSATAVLGWAGMAFFPSLKLLIILSLILSNLGIAATDVITDGFIVENSEGEKSHLFQSIAWGFRSLGAVLSSFIGGWLAEHWDPRHIFLLAALFPLSVMVTAWLIHEEKTGGGAPFRSMADPFKRCLKLLWKPHLRYFMALLTLTQASSMFGIPFFFYMKERLQFAESFLGLLMSLGWTGVVISSFVYAKTLKAVKPKKILAWAVIINTVNILSTFFITSQLTAFIFVFIGGLMTALTLLPVMSVAAMLTHKSGVEGTLFAVLMSVHNLGQIAFGFIGGKLYNTVGLAVLIAVSAVINLAGLWIVSKIDFSRVLEKEQTA